MTDRREAFGPRYNVSDEVLLFEMHQAFADLLALPQVKMYRPDACSITADQVRQAIESAASRVRVNAVPPLSDKPGDDRWCSCEECVAGHA